MLTWLRHAVGNVVLLFGFLGMTVFGFICISGAWLSDRDELASSAWRLMTGKGRA